MLSLWSNPRNSLPLLYVGCIYLNSPAINLKNVGSFRIIDKKRRIKNNDKSSSVILSHIPKVIYTCKELIIALGASTAKATPKIRVLHSSCDRNNNITLTNSTKPNKNPTNLARPANCKSHPMISPKFPIECL